MGAKTSRPRTSDFDSGVRTIKAPLTLFRTESSSSSRVRPGVKASQWVAAFAPSATPRDIIEALHGAFAKAATTPELQDAFEKGGMKVPAQSSLENEKFWLREEMANWKRVVDELRITLEE